MKDNAIPAENERKGDDIGKNVDNVGLFEKFKKGIYSKLARMLLTRLTNETGGFAIVADSYEKTFKIGV